MTSYPNVHTHGFCVCVYAVAGRCGRGVPVDLARSEEQHGHDCSNKELPGLAIMTGRLHNSVGL